MKLLTILGLSATISILGCHSDTRREIAPTGSRSDIQRTIDRLDGAGVVVIPAGEWELIGTVFIESDDITISGSTDGRTVLYRSSDDVNADLRNAAFFLARDTSDFRVTNLHMYGVSGENSIAAEKAIQLENVRDFRIDNSVIRYQGYSGVLITGNSSGVVDHNEIADTFKPAINNLGYGVTVMGNDEYSDFPFGSPDCTFIEDNFFSATRHAVASNRGARYVFRNNFVANNVNSHTVDAHGDEYNGDSNFGTEWIEVYNNVFEDPIEPVAAVRIRGGKGIIWGNTISSYTYAISLWETTSESTGPVYFWDNILDEQVTLLGSIKGSPEYYEKVLDDYEPFTYPHPLVKAEHDKTAP